MEASLQTATKEHSNATHCVLVCSMEYQAGTGSLRAGRDHRNPNVDLEIDSRLLARKKSVNPIARILTSSANGSIAAQSRPETHQSTYCSTRSPASDRAMFPGPRCRDAHATASMPHSRLHPRSGGSRSNLGGSRSCRDSPADLNHYIQDDRGRGQRSPDTSSPRRSRS